MIKRLRFKRSMFEGALDGGDDTIFLSEDKFKGFMSEIASFTEASNEEQAAREDSEPEQASCPSPLATCPLENDVTSFLTSLRDILQSPEKTKQLADAITQILNNN